MKKFALKIEPNLAALFIVLTVCIALLIISCNKEDTVLDAPKIEIDSASATGLSVFQASLSIDLGEGQKIMAARVIFDNITILTDPDIEIDIPITEERYQDTVVILHLDQLNHDFAVKAYLETEKYRYYSNELIARSVKNSFRPYILVNDNYGHLWDSVAICINKKSRFSVFIDYESLYIPNQIEVRLNKEIPLSIYFDFFEDIWFSGSSISTIGNLLLPEDLKAGIYGVDLFVEGHHYECAEKIKVLEGSWNVIDTLYPGEFRGDYANFLIGDKLYVVGGHIPVTLTTYSPVWRFDFASHQWTQLADFQHPGNPEFCEIYKGNMMYKDTGYIISRLNNDAFIWKYFQESDAWEKVTDYPGAANGSCIRFMDGPRIYMGGGKLNNTFKNDLWYYDLNSSIWIQCADIPVYNTGGSFASACSGGKAYTLTFDGFWEYSMLTDTWTRQSDFPGIERFGTSFITNGDKLFLIGGMYNDNGNVGLMDCWEYAVADKTWELRAFLPDYYGRGVEFIRNDKINVGLGYVHHVYWSFYSTTIYQLEL